MPFASSSAFVASMSSTRKATCEAPRLLDLGLATGSGPGLTPCRGVVTVSRAWREASVTGARAGVCVELRDHAGCGGCGGPVGRARVVVRERRGLLRVRGGPCTGPYRAGLGLRRAARAAEVGAKATMPSRAPGGGRTMRCGSAAARPDHCGRAGPRLASAGDGGAVVPGGRGGGRRLPARPPRRRGAVRARRPRRPRAGGGERRLLPELVGLGGC